MKVLVVAEFYPRVAEPALGIWAHRQALAARDHGAEVRVVVLHRPIAPAARMRDRAAWRAALAQPARVELDGLDVRYLKFVSPPRGRSYPHWGAFAAPGLALELRRIRRTFPYDLVHAHYAVPSADAVLRTRDRTPLVISEHGGDVFHTARLPAGNARVRHAFSAARLVLANSFGIERACRELGARRTKVVHLGTDLIPMERRPPARPTLVTVGQLIARKRQADVLRAMWILRERRPDLRYRLIGDGPERDSLALLARQLDLQDRVEFTGPLPHDEALKRGRDASVFVMPSTDEAFGVAYVEAMAAGLPAIGSRGEPGPEDIARLGHGMRLVPPGDPEALAGAIDTLLDGDWGARIGAAAQATVAAHFTWDACGAATVRAYEEALAG
ncbi:Putative teichuronic acid biosynthesis glycosyltransferase TuaC [Baekduia alba]|uniref:glycosyltransferase n=1 Tax=Baekduia alba TaxID=2997333 RepID=UPI0023407D83|nr:glycosyltransferase [Baekduia alba]WCB96605.1 Putative teichuronic acid biosynthesis glycosyltransferase TuaC [Baekduia alba]